MVDCLGLILCSGLPNGTAFPIEDFLFSSALPCRNSGMYDLRSRGPHRSRTRSFSVSGAYIRPTSPCNPQGDRWKGSVPGVLHHVSGWDSCSSYESCCPHTQTSRAQPCPINWRVFRQEDLSVRR
jgi:hypothetical protein